MTLSVRLRHGFPGFALDVAFEAPPGVTVLFGRSGSGKTSVANAVAGLLSPAGGRVAFEDVVLFDRDRRIDLPPHRRRIGYVFQEGRLFPHLTVRQNLRYGARFAPTHVSDDAYARIVDLLGLGPLQDRRPGGLSGGEKQRVAFGRAILCAPRLLIMDEPLAALDEARKAEILPYLERLRDETRLPILYVSHAVAEVARLATTVVMMEAGRVLRTGPAAMMLADPGMAPVFGLREAGAVLTARMAAQDSDGLSRVETAAGPLWLPRVEAAPGTALRLRVLAQDVIVARDRPVGLSALNILAVTVAAIRRGEGPGALVQLRAGDEMLLARITQRSVDALALAPGMAVFAVVKSVAIAASDVGAGEG